VQNGSNVVNYMDGTGEIILDHKLGLIFLLETPSLHKKSFRIVATTTWAINRMSKTCLLPCAKPWIHNIVAQCEYTCTNLGVIEMKIHIGVNQCDRSHITLEATISDGVYTAVGRDSAWDPFINLR
jgi:hypothetical protein